MSTPNRYITVRFLNRDPKNDDFSFSREYLYSTHLELVKNWIFSCEDGGQGCFHIRNSKGYDYGNALVIITNYFQDLDEVKEYAKECDTDFSPNRLLDLAENTTKALITMITGIEPVKSLNKYLYHIRKLICVPTCAVNAIHGVSNFGSNGEIYWIDLTTNQTESTIDECVIDQFACVKAPVTIEHKGYNFFNNTEKEEKNMNFNNYFKIGPKYTKDVKMSMYGPAFKVAENNTYLTYDKNTGNWINVNKFVFDLNHAFFAMPVAKSAIDVGDYILHNDLWVRVSAKTDDGQIVIENPFAKMVQTILPERSIFGFDFYTKLISLFDSINATSENPFGNPMMFMLMSDGDGFDNDLLPLMMMSQFNGGLNTDGMNPFQNPLMMMALMKNK